ncbi:beta subunit of citrate lyase [Jackrogersella minutella]|nr:beta subunit of citrate lyase [Jackrogersella minutella]
MAAARSTNILRRSLLYVPASKSRALTKSRTLYSDNVTYDLEDSVTPSVKPQAREALRDFLSENASRPPRVAEVAVRINAVSTGWASEDLATLAPLAAVDAVVVPKVNSASDLAFVADMLAHHAPERNGSGQSPDAIKILALIETARGVMDLREICAATPLLSGLIFAAEDFALDMSLKRTRSLDEFWFARSSIVTAARAANLPSAIDLVYPYYKIGENPIEGFREECEKGRAIGFNGKQCIHPGQLEMALAQFMPTKEETAWAVKIVIADEKAAADGKGAWTFEGAMIDAPVVGKARSIIDKAKTCNVDIDSLREMYKDTEPE